MGDTPSELLRARPFDTEVPSGSPSDKGTPIARSVRKATGLEVETARPPMKANVRHSRGPLAS